MTGANPDAETLKLVLWIAVGLIGLLITLIGILYKENKKYGDSELVQTQNAQKEQMDKLAAVVETIRETVASLKTIVEVVKQQQEERDPRTERRLNEHSQELKNINHRVGKLETTCSIYHNKQ